MDYRWLHMVETTHWFPYCLNNQQIQTCRFEPSTYSYHLCHVVVVVVVVIVIVVLLLLLLLG